MLLQYIISFLNKCRGPLFSPFKCSSTSKHSDTMLSQFCSLASVACISQPHRRCLKAYKEISWELGWCRCPILSRNIWRLISANQEDAVASRKSRQEGKLYVIKTWSVNNYISKTKFQQTRTQSKQTTTPFGYAIHFVEVAVTSLVHFVLKHTEEWVVLMCKA